MKDTSCVKVAVVGCGYWGKNLVRNFHKLGVLKGACDYNQDLLQNTCQLYNIIPLTYQDALMDKEIDGIVIAAPAEMHFDLTKKALEMDKNVFVEKPLSLQVKEAEVLCELAQKKGRILMVGHLLQYHPAFLELKNIIHNGRLGKIQYIYSNRLNLGKIRNEENILWSFAPHDLSMILSLAGELPEFVYATGSCHLNAHIHDVTTTHLQFKNGLQAHIFVSWLHPFKEQKLVVVGDRGMAVFDDGQSWDYKLQLYPHQVNWVNGLPVPEKAEKLHIPIQESEPLALECQHFIDSIQKNTKPRTDGEEGLRVLSVLEAAQTSLNTGARIYLNTKVAPLPYYSHETAIIDEGCVIGKGTKVWHFSHILKNTKIGKNCIIGQNVMIGPDVIIGNNCKIQNNVSLYKGVVLEDGVFCGPSCVFTNVNNPRAEIERKDEYRLTYVEKGVTIGANATIVCGVRLGAYSFIGAGAVVTKDVRPHALMVGNPARQVGWMSQAGEKLGDDLTCSRDKTKYKIDKNGFLIMDGMQ
jgi:predicted dehydrogenase/acetyltransferase-like isoleucine patch superfamily enzyme